MRILVGYDSAKPSINAFRHAQKLALLLEAQLDIATVVVRRTKDQAEEIEMAEKKLAAVARSCKDHEIECETHLLIKGGEPGEALIEFMSEHRFDTLVIGIRKTSRVEKLLLGSNAQYLILNSPCPVISVR